MTRFDGQELILSSVLGEEALIFESVVRQTDQFSAFNQVAFLAIGIQRELGNTENIAVHILQRQVHLPFGVFKDPHLRHFLGKEVCLCLCVAVCDAYQQHEALPYLSDGYAVYADLRARATLYYNSHILLQQ